MSSLTEVRLNTHDVEITLSAAGLIPPAVLRAIFVTTTQVGTDETRSRLQRLGNLSGGRHVAVVLLMARLESAQGNATTAMMRLQLE